MKNALISQSARPSNGCGSRRLAHRNAVIATETDAVGFGLNLVSDGYNILLNAECSALAGRLEALGYRPILIDLSELKKGGGSIKCVMAELRA